MLIFDWKMVGRADENSAFHMGLIRFRDFVTVFGRFFSGNVSMGELAIENQRVVGPGVSVFR
jgi:hypothetical protein